MTRFLFIASDYKPKPGGIAAYLDTLARGLIAIGHRVHVLGVIPSDDIQRMIFLARYESWVSPFPMTYDIRPQNRLGSQIVSLLEMARCLSPVFRKPLDRTPPFRSSAESIEKLRDILAKMKPDMIVFGHLDINQYPLVLLLKEQRVPYGIIAHDFEVHHFPERVNDVLRRGMMMKGAHWIAANSNHTKSEVRQWGVEDDRIIIVNPPVSEGAIQQTFLKTKDESDRVYTLITVCRVVRGKGIDITLRAVKILKERGIPCEYVIAGRGEDRDMLEELAAELGVDDCVRFVGPVSESQKWELLRSADVFVMPSRVSLTEQHEGFGIAFIEANACGIPAVGTRAGGIPDAIVEGETGVLVKPESPEELADALQRFYEHPEMRKKMGQAGMQRARIQFAPKKVAAHFLAEVTKRIKVSAGDTPRN